MISKLLIAWCLLALTVLINAVGLTVLLRSLSNSAALQNLRFWRVTLTLIRVAAVLVLLHLMGIAVWALFYWWQQCLPDVESALYFSGVTYATVGYGDLVLPKEWRLLGPVEGLTGILMCGLSAGVFFALVSKIYATKMGVKS